MILPTNGNCVPSIIIIRSVVPEILGQPVSGFCLLLLILVQVYNMNTIWEYTVKVISMVTLFELQGGPFHYNVSGGAIHNLCIRLPSAFIIFKSYFIWYFKPNSQTTNPRRGSTTIEEGQPSLYSTWRATPLSLETSNCAAAVSDQ